MTAPSTEEIIHLPPAEEKASRWEDFIDVFHSPAAVFRRRQDQGVWVPLLVVSLLMGIVSIAVFPATRPIFDAEMSRQFEAAMRQNPQLTPEMLATSRRIGEFMVRYGAAIGTPIMIAIFAMITWIIGKLFGSKQTLSAAFVVVSYATMITVAGMLVTGVQALLTDPVALTSQYQLHVGPARFLDPATTNPFMLAVLGRLNLFTVWHTVLIGVGYHVTGRMSKGSAAAAATLWWMIASAPAVRQEILTSRVR